MFVANHYHHYKVDSDGNGKSVSQSGDMEPHVHEVRSGVIQPAGKHEHSHKLPLNATSFSDYEDEMNK